MRGVTLVELIVTLALLGVILGLSGVAIASLRPSPQARPRVELERARMEAIRTGRAVRADSALFLPDGRAIGAGVDPLTGEINASR
jgi:prepilin-type N-terminal cleavage/methylation domain-containing protein